MGWMARSARARRTAPRLASVSLAFASTPLKESATPGTMVRVPSLQHVKGPQMVAATRAYRQSVLRTVPFVWMARSLHARRTAPRLASVPRAFACRLATWGTLCLALARELCAQGTNAVRAALTARPFHARPQHLVGQSVIRTRRSRIASAKSASVLSAFAAMPPSVQQLWLAGKHIDSD